MSTLCTPHLRLASVACATAFSQPLVLMLVGTKDQLGEYRDEKTGSSEQEL